MSDLALSRIKLKTLPVQIKEAELQILVHQRKVITCTNTLLENIQQQMTTPSSLLIASGIGFILSELTKIKPAESDRETQQPIAVETTDIAGPLMSTLKLLTSINAIYTAYNASASRTGT
ncbi:conserved hypothetical protein [Nitrosomonas nitrosa]|uniref:Uncharacterized protein n=1 Tax=Nitrosomonas nitrosa TaxID=52442 RepID=A0A8H8Z0T3_9PROT|nr:hypothetical protein [Nitrosomonas nitrosa]CAE6512225.1 conserved hypothetical protein [Nitrosomonas nitrosa]